MKQKINKKLYDNIFDSLKFFQIKYISDLNYSIVYHPSTGEIELLNSYYSIFDRISGYGTSIFVSQNKIHLFNLFLLTRIYYESDN